MVLVITRVVLEWKRFNHYSKWSALAAFQAHDILWELYGMDF